MPTDNEIPYLSSILEKVRIPMKSVTIMLLVTSITTLR